MTRDKQIAMQASILHLSRSSKSLITMFYDYLALIVALWGGFALRLSEWWPTDYLLEAIWLFAVIPLAGVFLLRLFGLYSIVVRYTGADTVWVVGKSVFILAFAILLLDEVLELPLLPRTVSIGFALNALILIGGSRFFFRQYFLWLQKNYVQKSPVLIYGAGAAGVRLVSGMSDGSEYLPCAFIDEDLSLQGKTVAGIKVYAPQDIEGLIKAEAIEFIFLAMPSVSHIRKKEILLTLETLPVHVQTLPTLDEIVNGQVSVEQVRDIQLEDLLGREPVPPIPDLFSACITGKVVMITGAGGSIGSELCRQVLSAQPSCLILFEVNEFSLYQIERSLQEQIVEQREKISIIPLLGSVCDVRRVKEVIHKFQVQTIYHAAAYKHVPMVEHNVIQGIENNVIGTQVVAQLALEYQVERFVLVSTDKAVRPTNVMGATKRLAEIVLQDLSQKTDKTIFSMVRFGNVLGSSGSVVPLFRKQINEGGPVTVTHPEITRFFMTIPEAASLVIQAGSMAHGGDVFVLDMGDPVKIQDLAKRMIHLTGKELYEENPENGIKLCFTGLRPGEKLYEELLIGDNVDLTDHPKIMKAQEEMMCCDQLNTVLGELNNTISVGDSQRARDVLINNVNGFNPSSELSDLLHAV